MRDGGWHGKLVPLVARGDLPGLSDPASLERFVECIEQSLIDHAAIRAGKNLPKATRGPGPEFEPFAEIKRLAEDDWHEAIWLAALATAVGWDRPESIGQLRRGMYQGEPWTWTRVVADGPPAGLRARARHGATAVVRFAAPFAGLDALAERHPGGWLEHGGRQLRVPLGADAARMPALVRDLVALDAQVEGISVDQPALEDAYLALVRDTPEGA